MQLRVETIRKPWHYLAKQSSAWERDRQQQQQELFGESERLHTVLELDGDRLILAFHQKPARQSSARSVVGAP